MFRYGHHPEGNPVEYHHGALLDPAVPFYQPGFRSRWYMENPKNVPEEFIRRVLPWPPTVPAAERYLEICDSCREILENGQYTYHSFPELSHAAWIESELENQRQKRNSDSSRIQETPPCDSLTENAEKPAQLSGAAHTRWTAPIVQALKELGGSGTPAQVRERIIENEHLTQEEISARRGKTQVNKFENEVAFARQDLVNGGYLDNSVHGIWTLTDAGKEAEITAQVAADLFRITASISRNNRKKRDILADGEDHSVHYWFYAPGKDASIGRISTGKASWPSAGRSGRSAGIFRQRRNQGKASGGFRRNLQL